MSGFQFEFVEVMPSMLNRECRLIGIDPDVDKSGVAIVENGKLFELKNLSFWDLIDFISENRNSKIFVEAGWLNKSASHHFAENKFIAAAMGSKVGSNWQTGKLIVDYCRRMQIEVIEIKPTAKKINAIAFRAVTGWKSRTNQETRDAAMLVFGRN